MGIPRPARVELSPAEEALAARISFDLPHLTPGFFDRLRESCSAAVPLARSLLDRRAIPEIRLRYFTDPAFNIGSRRSRMEAFEANGVRDDHMLGHGNFLPYLRYFIFGPKLPLPVLEEAHHLINANPFYPEDQLESLRKLARAATRRYALDRHEAAEEFFKLALEYGFDVGHARSIRQGALNAR